MAVAAGDSLLERPRAAFVPFQQIRAVVCLYDESVHVPNSLGNLWGDESEIREPSEPASWRKEIVSPPCGKFKSHWVVGVVGEGEALDREIPKAEGGAGVEELPFRFDFQFWLQGLGSHRIRENVGSVLLREGRNSRGMVAVFVGYEDRVNFVGSHASLFQHACQSLAAKASVDQDVAVLGDKQTAIAGTAAAEDGELHGHRQPVLRLS